MIAYRAFIVVLVLVIGSLQVRLWYGQGSFAHVSSLQSQVDLRAAENESNRQRNTILKAEVKDLRTGLDAIEELARSELGLIKQGEVFYLLVEK